MVLIVPLCFCLLPLLFYSWFFTLALLLLFFLSGSSAPPLLCLFFAAPAIPALLFSCSDFFVFFASRFVLLLPGTGTLANLVSIPARGFYGSQLTAVHEGTDAAERARSQRCTGAVSLLAARSHEATVHAGSDAAERTRWQRCKGAPTAPAALMW